MLRRYGITLEEYEFRLAAQSGRCACCGRTDVGRKGKKAGLQLMVDHDHKTGEVRGLICHKCNVGVGSLGDDVAGVQRAAIYLSGPVVTDGIGAGLLW